MKSMLVVLLVCLVIAVKGRGDPCTQGGSAIGIFMEARSCAGRDLWAVGEELFLSIRDNATVEDVDYVFTNYCSTVFPVMVRCFRDRIQNCSADQRDYLTTVLDNTGFACEPNTANVNPYFKHLLTHFSNADLVRSEACQSMESNYDVIANCIEKGIEATGMTMEQFQELLRNGTVQEVLPLVAPVLNTALECLVGKVRDVPEGKARCAQWRGMALRLIITRNLFPTVLGRIMTFSQQQLVDMFEFQDAHADGSSTTCVPN